MHLAILAVAPLFLYLFVSPPVESVVLLWCSLSAVTWIFMEPSLRSGEYLHDARSRVVSCVARDPLFWTLVAAVGVTGVCAFNGGVSLVYDAENAQWQISEALFPFLPSCIDNSGTLLFSATAAIAVVTVGVRHALGRSARMLFLALSSSLAGMVAILLFAAVYDNREPVMALLSRAEEGYSFVGLVFGFYLLGGTVALISAIENRWNFMLFLCVFAIGGTAIGVFCFSPVYMFLSVMLAEVIVLLYSFVFVCKVLQATFQLKFLAGVFMCLVISGLLVAGMFPEPLLQPKLEAIIGFLPFSEGFWETRDILSRVAFKTWYAKLWLGGGFASFPLDFRFFAQASDWQSLPRGALAVANGWWLILAERGLWGLVVLTLPILLLIVHYFRRLVSWFRVLDLPHPACWIALCILALGITLGFFDCSFFRDDALMAALPMVAVSAASFSAAERRDHV